ncbi:MAG: glycoside hydrolase family 116 protein [Pseudomonadales bacterium]|nr:glycoside hydrolase family 116 protein [Pseudomonadales bacterium]
MPKDIDVPPSRGVIRLIVFFGAGAEAVKKLWNGQYFTQNINEHKTPHQYGKGCLSDQLFGYTWSTQVGLGYLYPKSNIRKALESIWKYNWTPDVAKQTWMYRPERYYATPGQAGLFICTWPISKHPQDYGVRYRNEVWTGIEYQVATSMIAEGMLTEGLSIIRAINDRYDGTEHNPWNEIECGDHYARAMAGWGCLIALGGFEYDGPAGMIGMNPKITPAKFESFFTAAEGWGTMSQNRNANSQTNCFNIRYGKLKVQTLAFTAPAGKIVKSISITANGKPVASEFTQTGNRVTVKLSAPATVVKSNQLKAQLNW